MSEREIKTGTGTGWAELMSDPRLQEGKPLLEKALAFIQQDWVKTEFPGLTDASCEMAHILLQEMDQDTETMVTVMFWTIVDKGRLSLEEIGRNYAPGIAALLSALRKIDGFDTRKAHSNVENFIKLLLTSSDDIRVILIRTARKLYQIRHITEFTKEQQEEIFREASILYLPITHRIGLYKLKTEFEDR